VTQKKKRLSLIRSMFLSPGLQHRSMILLRFPVTTPSSSNARAVLWTSLILSHSLGKFSSLLPRCFPSLEAWPLPTAPAGKTCPALSPCLWAHAPELGQENTASALVQRKQLSEQGQPGLTW